MHMDNKIINKFLKFVSKEVTPTIKKDFRLLSQVTRRDLEKFTKEKEFTKKNK